VNEAWIAIAGLTAGTVVIKAAGPLLAGGREMPPPVNAVISLLAPALLTALVVVQTLGGSERGITLDARAAGIAAAAVAVLLRLPMVAIVVLAAGVAALVRLVT
jgi:branched-subunit amino acid transport protein